MQNAMIACAVILAACGGDDNVSRLLGARCDIGGDCDDRCLGPSNEFPDGFCSLDCSASADCPDEAACILKDGGICLFTCFDDIDCDFLGSGWSCRDNDVRGGGTARVCIGI